jgi:hypothetical protein
VGGGSARTGAQVIDAIDLPSALAQPDGEVLLGEAGQRGASLVHALDVEKEENDACLFGEPQPLG